ncbi:protein FAM228B isoform X2 [Sphaerodactylus townsendi]|uniref:protein FAM228B isoform X2 n=1 Tax=Sphaerodactylus townsendi TaxID=933632 RepID=UPI002026C85D|nr:protein FAM228B isoform X2 [Sphaerodactylus townsendi]
MRRTFLIGRSHFSSQRAGEAWGLSWRRAARRDLGDLAKQQPSSRLERRGRGKSRGGRPRRRCSSGAQRRPGGGGGGGAVPAAAGWGAVAGEGMEAARQRPRTAPGSTPKATPPPPLPVPSESMVSSSSLSSDSLDEDWLMKITCPGARHRYSRNVRSRKPAKTEFLRNVDTEDEIFKCSTSTSYQSYMGLPRTESSELDWLIRLRCPRAQMEKPVSDPKQSLPAVSPLSKTGGSHLPLRAKPSGSWLAQKHLSAMQVVVSGQQCAGDSTQSLLERENCFVREVDRYLKHNDFIALRRKEMQYKKWFENVSSPLLQKIQDKVDSQSSEEIEERKRKQLSLYLNYQNKQHGAFLESYNPSAYDPFFLQSTDFWKVSVPPLCDPLLKEVQGRYLEEGIIRQCDAGRMYSSKEMSEFLKADLPLLPLCRQVMNPIEWLKIPSGYVDSEVRQKSRRRMNSTRNKSSMDFKCWGDQTWLLPSTRRASAWQ